MVRMMEVSSPRGFWMRRALRRGESAGRRIWSEPASAVAKRLSQKYSRRKRDVYAMVLDMQ